MTPDIDTPRWTDADAFYEALLDAHLGLSREDSEAFNARLVLVLANQVGDLEVLKACLAAACAAQSD
jgi:Protein of unknown function (DUF2783)